MNRFSKIFICFLCSLYSVVLSAQSGAEKVEALRTNFIAKRLALSSSESDKFWPVYNEYNDKVKAIRKNLRQTFHKRSESLTDQEAEELYQLEQRSRQAEYEVHKVYSERIKNIIGAKKIVLLRIAEEDFKREMISSIKDKSE